MTKFKPIEIISLLIAIAAFIISYISFYYQYLKTEHSLKISAYYDLNDWSRKNTTILTNGVIANYGNTTEVLYSGQLNIGDSGEYATCSRIDPIVLKPGEAKTFALSDSLNFIVDNLGAWDNKRENATFTVWLDLVVVSPDGDNKHLKYSLGNLQYNDPSENYNAIKDSATSNRWVLLN